MILLAVSTLAAVVGAWFLTGCLGLRRGLQILTAFVVVLVAQVVGLVLLVGGALRELSPTGLTIGSVALAALEVTGTVWLAGPSLRTSNGAVSTTLRRAVRATPRHPLIAAMTVLVLAEYAWQAVLSVRLPPVAYDGLAYHLIAPATWVQHGAITHSPQNLFADVYPEDQEALTAWTAAFVHNMWYAGLSVFPFSVMGSLSVASLCRGLQVRRTYAVIAGLGFVAMPVAFLQAGTAYVDVAAGATALAALSFLLAFRPDHHTRGARVIGLVGPLFVSGIATGLAAGVKSSNLVLVPFVLVLAVIIYWRTCDRAGVDPVKLRPRFGASLGWVMAPMAALSAFWYLRTWVTYGSPVFPVTMLGFNGYGPQSRIIIGANKPAILDHTPGGMIGEAIRSWATDLHHHPYSYAADLGGFGPQWLLLGFPALVAAVVILVHRRRFDYLLGLILPTAILAAVSDAAWWSRYTIALAGTGWVCFAYCVEQWASVRRVALARLAAVPSLAFMALTVVTMWWATSPTYYPVVSGGSLQLASVGQLTKLMSQPVAVRFATASPWFEYQALSVVPPGAIIAEPVDNNDPLTLPLVGLDLQHRLVVLGAAASDTAAEQVPRTARDLRQEMQAAQAHYVVVADAGATESLVRSMEADPAHFAQLGSVGGSDLYRLGSFKDCGSPTVAVTATRAVGRDLTVSALVAGRCDPLSGVPVALWTGHAEVPIWQGTESILATPTTGITGRLSVTIHDPRPDQRYFFRYAGGLIGNDRYGTSASTPFLAAALLEPQATPRLVAATGDPQPAP